MKTAIALLVLSFFALLFVRSSSAAGLWTTYTALLDNTKEVGNQQSNESATATGTLVLEPDGATVSYARLVITKGPFTTGNITACHIHQGSASVNGPIAFFLFVGNPSAPYTNVFPLTLNNFVLNSTFQNNLINQGLYFNIHTTVNPAGAIRGQIVFAFTNVTNPTSTGTSSPASRKKNVFEWFF